MSQLNLKEYSKFVEGVTSEDSNDTSTYIRRLQHLADNGLNIALLDTAASGLSSEGGEVMEIVKKIKYHGKDFDEDTRFHLKRELGDVIFYWISACRALDYDPMEIIAENVSKLEKRYPGGFSRERSENRAPDDI